MTKSWVLFFLGTLAYFFYRYINRSDKSKEWSWKFWLNENFPELALSFIIDLALAIIALDQ